MKLKRVPNPAKLGDSKVDAFIARHASGLTFAFWPRDKNMYDICLVYHIDWLDISWVQKAALFTNVRLPIPIPILRTSSGIHLLFINLSMPWLRSFSHITGFHRLMLMYFCLVVLIGV